MRILLCLGSHSHLQLVSHPQPLCDSLNMNGLVTTLKHSSLLSVSPLELQHLFLRVPRVLRTVFDLITGASGHYINAVLLLMEQLLALDQ